MRGLAAGCELVKLTQKEEGPGSWAGGGGEAVVGEMKLVWSW